MPTNAQLALADRVMGCLPDGGMSWKQLYSATGKPTESALTNAVRLLEKKGKIERVHVPRPAKCKHHEDFSRVPRVLIRRKA